MTLADYNPDDYTFFRELKARRSKPKTAPAGPATISPVDFGSGLGSKYGLTALARELDALRAAPEGTRNHTLNKACFSLSQIVAAGHLDTNHTYQELYNTAISIGLTDTETRATLASAYQAGSAQPRDIKPGGSIAPTVTLLRPQPQQQQEAQEQTTPAADSGVRQYNSPAEIMGVEERTSWWPRNIEDAITGVNTEPEPTILGRSDGVSLFYAGRVNGIIGESESGKTWVALQAVLEQARAGYAVTYIDFEDTATGVISRLKTLGLTEDEIRAHVAYINPDENLGIPEAADLQEHLQQHQPTLIVIDGMNAAMTLMGLDLMSNQDTTKFAQTLLNPLAATGAAVCFIDHTPKGGGESKGGIGAQAKRAMTTGCTLKAEIVEPFGRGQNGRLNLWVDKDRPGHVAGNSILRSGVRYVASVDVISNSLDETLAIQINDPHPTPGQQQRSFEPTYLMEQVSRLLEDLDGQPVSFRQIDDAITGKQDNIRKAVNTLIEQGHIKREPGKANRMNHTLLNPYREPGSIPEPTTLDPSQTQTEKVRQLPAKTTAGKTQIMTSTGHIVDPSTGEIMNT